MKKTGAGCRHLPNRQEEIRIGDAEGCVLPGHGQQESGQFREITGEQALR